MTEALGACTLFVVLGTRTYGKEGAEVIDTKKEFEFALRQRKDIAVVKMTDAFAETFAQVRGRVQQRVRLPVREGCGRSQRSHHGASRSAHLNSAEGQRAPLGLCAESLTRASPAAAALPPAHHAPSRPDRCTWTRCST